MENIEHSNMIYKKVKIDLYTQQINLNKYQLYKAIIFLYDDLLKDIRPHEIPNIHIRFSDNLQYNGTFYVYNQSLIIEISPNNILKDINQKLLFTSHLKSLFYIFLHETYLLIDFLTSYIKVKNKMTMDEFLIKKCENDEIKIRTICEDHNIENRDLACIQLTKEIESERFAYKNLSYFENLYIQNSNFYTNSI